MSTALELLLEATDSRFPCVRKDILCVDKSNLRIAREYSESDMFNHLESQLNKFNEPPIVADEALKLIGPAQLRYVCIDKYEVVDLRRRAKDKPAARLYFVKDEDDLILRTAYGDGIKFDNDPQVALEELANYSKVIM